MSCTVLYQNLIVNQVGVALRSFWSFEGASPMKEMQERRLRRYLNWYWRRVQLRRSPSLAKALIMLARQPCIEICGLHRRVSADRIFIEIHEPGGFAALHLGLVLEDGRIVRKGSSVDASLHELLRAFSEHDQTAIERFFDATFDHVKQTGEQFQWNRLKAKVTQMAGVAGVFIVRTCNIGMTGSPLEAGGGRIRNRLELCILRPRFRPCL